jgi:hypothetical protein
MIVAIIYFITFFLLVYILKVILYKDERSKDDILLLPKRQWKQLMLWMISIAIGSIYIIICDLYPNLKFVFWICYIGIICFFLIYLMLMPKFEKWWAKLCINKVNQYLDTNITKAIKWLMRLINCVSLEDTELVALLIIQVRHKIFSPNKETNNVRVAYEIISKYKLKALRKNDHCLLTLLELILPTIPLM